MGAVKIEIEEPREGLRGGKEEKKNNEQKEKQE